MACADQKISALDALASAKIAGNEGLNNQKVIAGLLKDIKANSIGFTADCTTALNKLIDEQTAYDKLAKTYNDFAIDNLIASINAIDCAVDNADHQMDTLNSLATACSQIAADLSSKVSDFLTRIRNLNVSCTDRVSFCTNYSSSDGTLQRAGQARSWAGDGAAISELADTVVAGSPFNPQFDPYKDWLYSSPGGFSYIQRNSKTPAGLYIWNGKAKLDKSIPASDDRERTVTCSIASSYIWTDAMGFPHILSYDNVSSWSDGFVTLTTDGDTWTITSSDYTYTRTDTSVIGEYTKQTGTGPTNLSITG